MYKLPDYIEKDHSKVLAFMQEHSFATLCGVNAENKPVVTQVPILFKQDGNKLFLRGHVMKQTDHEKAFQQNPNVLVVFTGPHCYVSASWYSNQQQASTWNYISVHAKGVMHFLQDDDLLQMLKDTTAFYEGETSAASFDNLSPEYVQRLSKAIVAFEIEVTEIENVFKLSQNRDEKSFINIVDKLKNGDHDEQLIAAEMQKIQQELFQKAETVA
jgi:transcriptional regulator